MAIRDPFAKRVIPLIDLTRLAMPCTGDDVADVCLRAKSAGVAAVCVWPEFSSIAREKLGESPVRLSTVLDFAHTDAPASALEEGEEEDRGAAWRESDGLACAFHDRVGEGVKRAVEPACPSKTPRAADYVPDEADEVEMFFPWEGFVAGATSLEQGQVQSQAQAQVQSQLEKARALCGEKRTLKVTLEAGLYPPLERLRAACDLSIEAGADFLTISTGKREKAATLEAVRVLCEASKAFGKQVGIKVSGGVRDAEEARVYLDLVSGLMGLGWIEAGHFRFGTNPLLDVLEEA